MTKFPDNGLTTSERARIRKVFKTENREDYELLIHELAVLTNDYANFGIISVHPAMLLHKIGFAEIELHLDTQGNLHTLVELTYHFMKAMGKFIRNSEPGFTAMLKSRTDPSKISKASSINQVPKAGETKHMRPTDWFEQTNYLFTLERLQKELRIKQEPLMD